MRDYKKYKLKFNPYLDKLYNSDKSLIIYKVTNGYNIYTDFSKKIILNNNNINSFFKFFNNKIFKKETDILIGFFGYEIGMDTFNAKMSLSRTSSLKVRRHKSCPYRL